MRLFIQATLLSLLLSAGISSLLLAMSPQIVEHEQRYKYSRGKRGTAQIIPGAYANATEEVSPENFMPEESLKLSGRNASSGVPLASPAGKL